MKLIAGIILLAVASFCIFWAMNLSYASHLAGLESKSTRWQITAALIIAGAVTLIAFGTYLIFS